MGIITIENLCKEAKGILTQPNCALNLQLIFIKKC